MKIYALVIAILALIYLIFQAISKYVDKSFVNSDVLIEVLIRREQIKKVKKRLLISLIPITYIVWYVFGL